MSSTSPRWLSVCTGCSRDAELESRPAHGQRALCDVCASRPPRSLVLATVAEMMNAEGTVAGTATGASVPQPRIVSAREFLAQPRKPIEPFIATADGKTVLLAAETTLLVAGPSGVGKSLAASFDLAGRLARDVDSEWLGLTVRARRRVLLLAFEGSDEDNADRFADLIEDDAADRFLMWDRWRGLDLPQTDPVGRGLLAEAIKSHQVDVLVIDTATAYFGAEVAVDRGEEAHTVLEELRARSGRRFAAIVVAHTKKADRKGMKVDELEEISGTFSRKADAAIVIRRGGDDESDPHRRVVFAKVRRGPQPRAKLAAFPSTADGPPRLELVGDVGRPQKPGTDGRAIAEWIREHDEPVSAAALRDRFKVSDTTLRRRGSDELVPLGIRRDRLPGCGNAHGYGTDEQWRTLELGESS
jgi:hypothetical protein